MKIVAVCSFGVGSSVIAKMNIENILESEKRDDFSVETIDVGSIRSVEADLYVTTNELAEDFPEDLKTKTLVLNNFVNQEEIKAALDERFKEMGY